MQSAPQKLSTSTSVWPLYLAAGGLGIAFLVTLLVLAWDNALEREVQRFGFESLSVDDTVRTNVQAAHDAIGNLARVVSVVPNLSEEQFSTLTADVLSQYPYITSVGRYRKSGAETFKLVISNGQSSKKKLPDIVDVNVAGGFATVFSTAQLAAGAVPSEKLASGGAAGEYVLAQAVNSDAGDNGNLGNYDIVVILITPNLLLENIAASADLAVTLFSESEGVGGRQLLFERAPVVSTKRWNVDILEQSTQIRFDRYSMRLIANKNLYWSDLGKALLFTAAVLGIGVTLLLVALARAKDLQARELLARNKVIEDQVTRQTFELAEARDQALEASRVKSDFLASMSHEIRTPLNAIIGMAELLADTELSGDQVKFVSVFKNAGEALLSLVNDILDLSKIEAGQLILEEIAFDVREIVEQSAEIYALKTDAKGIELTSQVSPDVPVRLKGDPSRLRQVILNLIGNAIKFTEQGEIVVRVAAVEQVGSKLKLLFSVADTGIGIPQSKLESIFGSFTQVDSSTTRKYGGTGLGLTISQKLVEKMQGRIWVESVEGAGSTFKFEIQVEAISAPDLSSDVAPKLEGRTVLVIDDNETNRLILKETIEAVGGQVAEAADGQQALDYFEQPVHNDPKDDRDGSINSSFDLILCDVQMPGMDGFEVAQKIVDLGAAGSTLMMLSSANLARDLEQTQKLGLGGYLVKPIKRTELFNALVGVITPVANPKKVVVENTQSAAATTARIKRILLVEDNPDNRLLIKAYLKKQPYSIDEAEHGQQGVELFIANDYDIVLMDVQMPIMDGHTATRTIREYEAQQQSERITPIVALTAHAIKEEQEKSLAAGCNAHLTKPIKKQTLISALEEMTAAPEV